MRQTIWVTGASGRLGAALIKQLEKSGEYKIIGTDKDVDITDMQAVEHAVDLYRPNTIINCASISDVEYCELNMVEAFKVNALGARNLASVSRRKNAKMIQLSTDDVFDGRRTGAVTEYDTPSPITIYGKSKLAGENYVRELNPKHLIIRSSWVYGVHEGNYFSYVVEKGKKNEPFEAPVDQISSPTSAAELSKLIECLLEQSEYGIYHASCEGMCSRYEFARAILNLMGYDRQLVTQSYTQRKDVPYSALLENLMMKMTGVYTMPNWREDLEAYIAKVK